MPCSCRTVQPKAAGHPRGGQGKRPGDRSNHSRTKWVSLTWNQQFFDPIELPRGNKLVTLREPQIGSCPLAWCSWRWVTAFAGKGRAGQLAIAGRLTMGSSLNGAMVSRVM